MGIVKNITDTPISSYDLNTQTPNNYNPKNFYPSTLQKKINADWNLRPNRVSIEQELEKGSEVFSPLEVIMQSVKDDKGEIISDNWRRLVFKDIRQDCRIGTRFKFGYNFEDEESEQYKSIWISKNRDTSSMTSSVVVVRCNTTIGNTYTDSQGVLKTHYEPVIITKDLKTANLFYNQTVAAPQGQLTIICQHNKWTKNYYINQRFVIGYDQVYRITGMNKFDSNFTYQTEDVGVMIMYLEYVEISQKDNFTTRIAYNGNADQVETEESTNTDYELRITSPEILPTYVKSTPVQFTCKLFSTEGLEITSSVSVEATLNNTTAPQNYYQLDIIDDNNFTIKRLKYFGGGPLQIKCFIPAESSPSGAEIFISFDINLNAL